jgi:hypothetical protein
VWTNIRPSAPYSRQTTRYHARGKRGTSAPNRNNYKRSKKREYYRENDHKSSINIDKTDRLTDPLPNSKRNGIIVRPPPYSYRDSHARRSRNAGPTQAPPMVKIGYRGVRHETGTGNTETQIKPTHKQRRYREDS